MVAGRPKMCTFSSCLKNRRVIISLQYTFLDALASLDFKLWVSESVIDIFRFPVSQVISVSQVIPVIPVSQVIPVIPVIPVSQVIPVIPVIPWVQWVQWVQ